MGDAILEVLKQGGAIIWPILGIVNMMLGWFLWSLKARFPSAERMGKLEDRMKTVETKLENLPSSHAIYALGREIEMLHGDVKSLKTAITSTNDTMKAVQKQTAMLIQHHIDLEKK